MDFQEQLHTLDGLDCADLYQDDFLLTWDKSADEMRAVLAVADALRALSARTTRAPGYSTPGSESRCFVTTRPAPGSPMPRPATCWASRCRTSTRARPSRPTARRSRRPPT